MRRVQEEVLGLDVAVNEVPIPQEFKRAGQLLQKVSNNNLVEAASRRVGILHDHIRCGGVSSQSIAFLDEVGEIPQLAELHDKVYVGRCLLTIDESNDMWVMEAFQDMNFGVEVLFELLVELLQVDRFNSYVATSLLFLVVLVSVVLDKDVLSGFLVDGDRQECSRICNDAQVDCQLGHHGTIQAAAYHMYGFVDGCKAPSSNLLHPAKVPYRHIPLS